MPQRKNAPYTLFALDPNFISPQFGMHLAPRRRSSPHFIPKYACHNMRSSRIISWTMHRYDTGGAR